MKYLISQTIMIATLTAVPALSEEKVHQVEHRCAAACVTSFKSCYNGQADNDKTCDESKQACMAVCPKPKEKEVDTREMKSEG